MNVSHSRGLVRQCCKTCETGTFGHSSQIFPLLHFIVPFSHLSLHYHLPASMHFIVPISHLPLHYHLLASIWHLILNAYHVHAQPRQAETSHHFSSDFLCRIAFSVGLQTRKEKRFVYTNSHAIPLACKLASCRGQQRHLTGKGEDGEANRDHNSHTLWYPMGFRPNEESQSISCSRGCHGQCPIGMHDTDLPLLHIVSQLHVQRIAPTHRKVHNSVWSTAISAQASHSD